MLSGSWISGFHTVSCCAHLTPCVHAQATPWGRHRNSLVSLHQGKAPLALHFATIQMLSRGEDGYQAFPMGTRLSKPSSWWRAFSLLLVYFPRQLLAICLGIKQWPPVRVSSAERAEPLHSASRGANPRERLLREAVWYQALSRTEETAISL